MPEKHQAITADLEELASRGFGHPEGQAIVGRIRVTVAQLADEAAAGGPKPAPLDVQLGEMHAILQGLAREVPKVVQRQTDVGADVQGLAGQFGDLAAKVAGLADQVAALATAGAPKP